ncbi:dephospho-CoA kinase [Oceaniserpentilla sp. 4NH20-0058]|uniref:dephospho-CoA kinase n=1 Tax=Oceaniserpentilla sp. 4NH20-0058 TaxID=3127660 RepID=UPI00310805FD
MLIIGVTGGIGSGKTAVTNAFSELGITIVDADIAARTVVAVGSQGLNEITKHFGDDILLNDGTLDRAKLRNIIFSDPNEKKWLENLTHPLIREEIKTELAASTSPYTILVSPLLVESSQKAFVNRILVVDVPVELQIQRTSKRDNNTSQQVQAIIQSQADRDTRLSYADDVIVNDQSLEHLQQQVAQLHKQYLSFSELNHES